MYRWLIFFHILGVFGFLVSHGASMHMAFALQRERDPERLRALLGLSSSSYQTMFPSLGLIVLTGVLTGFQGHWWRYGWIWVSLVLLIGISAAMMPFGSAIYGAIRQALEPSNQVTGREASASPSKSPQEIDALLKKANPLRLAVIGYGGLALLAWLMIFKPF
jgi:MFS family permease